MRNKSWGVAGRGRPRIEWEEYMRKVTKKGKTLTGGDQVGEG
jgi:hypothetical protein